MFCFQSFWWKFRMWLAKQCFHIDVHNYFQSKHKYNTTTSGHIASIHDIHTDVGLHFLWKQRLPNRRRSEIETPIPSWWTPDRLLTCGNSTSWKTWGKFVIWLFDMQYVMRNIDHRLHIETKFYFEETAFNEI